MYIYIYIYIYMYLVITMFKCGKSGARGMAKPTT